MEKSKIEDICSILANNLSNEELEESCTGIWTFGEKGKYIHFLFLFDGTTML